MKREDVYKLIDGERAYQDSLWNANTTTTGGKHSIEEWIMYIEQYLGKAKTILCSKSKQVADPEAADIMRKVAGMSVACLEQHDAPPRNGY